MTYAIRRVTSATLFSAHEFHTRHLTPHLFPRSQAELWKIAQDGELLVIDYGGTIIGACYVKQDDTEAGAEFGGVCVDPYHTGKRLGSAVGAVAICMHLAANPQTDPLIAHVHRDNQMPRKMLAGLGFIQTGQLVLKPHEVPNGMARDADGTVTGHEFTFDRTFLTQVANEVERLLTSPDFTVEDIAGASWTDVLNSLRKP